MNEKQIEKEIQDKGLNAPRLTPDHIDSVIVNERYWQPADTTLTVCALELKNGTQVTGESACVSPENFDVEIGRKIARQNAREKIWALEGYLLKQNLSNAIPDAEADQEPLKVGDKVIAVKGALKPGTTGVVEVIREHASVGVRTGGGNLWHEASWHWKKVA
jgi:hypothetical protein